jgi:hypothetical protein
MNALQGLVQSTGSYLLIGGETGNTPPQVPIGCPSASSSSSVASSASSSSSSATSLPSCGPLPANQPNVVKNPTFSAGESGWHNPDSQFIYPGDQAFINIYGTSTYSELSQ